MRRGGRFRLTVRAGAQVTRERFDALEPALEALEQRMRALEGKRLGPVQMRVRTFEPVQRVAARAELRGPGRVRPALRGGVDLRGDGSAEPYTGRWRKQLVERRAGETAYDALRRVLGGDGGAAT